MRECWHACLLAHQASCQLFNRGQTASDCAAWHNHACIGQSHRSGSGPYEALDPTRCKQSTAECWLSLPVSCRATLLNVNEPEIRGLALALQTVLDDVGRGMGPFLVAMLIGKLGR